MTKSGKHCVKRRNWSFWAISSFVTMFSKRCLLQRCQKASIWGKGLKEKITIFLLKSLFRGKIYVLSLNPRLSIIKTELFWILIYHIHLVIPLSQRKNMPQRTLHTSWKNILKISKNISIKIEQNSKHCDMLVIRNLLLPICFSQVVCYKCVNMRIQVGKSPRYVENKFCYRYLWTIFKMVENGV